MQTAGSQLGNFRVHGQRWPIPAHGYEVGSCSFAAGATWPFLLPLGGAHAAAQLSSFAIIYDPPLRTGPSGGLLKTR